MKKFCGGYSIGPVVRQKRALLPDRRRRGALGALQQIGEWCFAHRSDGHFSLSTLRHLRLATRWSFVERWIDDLLAVGILRLEENTPVVSYRIVDFLSTHYSCAQQDQRMEGARRANRIRVTRWRRRQKHVSVTYFQKNYSTNTVVCSGCNGDSSNKEVSLTPATNISPAAVKQEAEPTQPLREEVSPALQTPHPTPTPATPDYFAARVEKMLGRTIDEVEAELLADEAPPAPKPLPAKPLVAKTPLGTALAPETPKRNKLARLSGDKRQVNENALDLAMRKVGLDPHDSERKHTLFAQLAAQRVRVEEMDYAAHTLWDQRTVRGTRIAHPERYLLAVIAKQRQRRGEV